MKIPGLDTVKNLFHRGGSSKKKADAVPKSTSLPPTPISGKQKQERPDSPIVSKNARKPISFLDQFTNLVTGKKGKKKKTKTSRTSRSDDIAPHAGTSVTVKSATGKEKSPTGRKRPSMIDTISGIFHRQKGEKAQPDTGTTPPARVSSLLADIHVSPQVPTPADRKTETPGKGIGTKKVLKPVSFLDRLTILIIGKKGKKKKKKPGIKTRSTVQAPQASGKDPFTTDAISDLVRLDNEKRAQPDKRAKTVPEVPLTSTGKNVSPAVPDLLPDEMDLIQRKKQSTLDPIKRVFHEEEVRDTEKRAQSGNGAKTASKVPMEIDVGGASQSVPELLPDEMELYLRPKESNLDPLKRLFHEEEAAGETDTPGKKKKPDKGKIEKKPILQYDPVMDGPLVEPALPEGYREIYHYWSNVGVSLVVVALNEMTSQNEYLLFEPVLSEFQYELIERIHADLRNILILNDTEIVQDKRELLLGKMNDLFQEYGIKPDPTTLFKLQYYLVRNFLGWGRIDALMRDPYIEDISCDGTMIPLFLYHRKFRNIKTNITFKAEVLDSLAITLAQRSGKHISTGAPIIDATLPEGSRLQLTFGKEVTTRGTSFTIRKFREEPFSPIELLINGTFNEEQLVYFWMAIENNKSLLFIGGTASGKTTSLNAASLFIPPMAKVVSIEDTREITLYHENWIASVTRDSIAEGASMISMFDLLRAAMRQRPEYILVGEVRGVEAQTLFQAMNTGHTTFSTLHAGNVDAAIHRLESEPLNVPRNMLQALNVISVQALVYRGQERIRRVQEIVEIAGADPITGSLRVNTVFTYDPVTDVFNYSGRSQVYADITQKRGWSREQFEDEIRVRKIILTAMKEQGILNYILVSKLFQDYYINPAGVIEGIKDLKSFLEREV